jgi:predicted ester cyclase
MVASRQSISGRRATMAERSQDNVSRYRELVEAYNRHDVDRGAGFYHEDAVVTDHGARTTMSGREEIRAEYWEGYFEASGDQRMDDVDVIAAGDWTVARAVISGTDEGLVPGLEPTGRRFEVSACDLVRWEDGEVVEEHLYYDQYTVLEQLGQVPSLTSE